MEEQALPRGCRCLRDGDGGLQGGISEREGGWGEAENFGGSLDFQLLMYVIYRMVRERIAHATSLVFHILREDVIYVIGLAEAEWYFVSADSLWQYKFRK